MRLNAVRISFVRCQSQGFHTQSAIFQVAEQQSVATEPVKLVAKPWTPASKRVGAIGIKIGMIPQWDASGYVHPCTVIALANCEVVQAKTEEKEGYTALQLGCGPKKLKKTTKPMLGHFQKAGVEPKRVLAEFRVTPDALLPPGTPIVARHFVPGQFIDVTGTSTGKGFQGGMKRWGFKGLAASHGVSVSHRSLGGTGQREDPGRVFKGKKMPGHMGVERCTIQNLWLFKVDTLQNLLLVRGHVPGHAGNYVYVKDAVKKPMPVAPPFPTFIATGQESQERFIEAQPLKKSMVEEDEELEEAMAAEIAEGKKGGKKK